MRKIFLDCGSYDGCSTRMFLDIRDDAEDFEIYCFEPNPNLAHYHPVKHATFANKAVWIKNTKIPFFVHNVDGGSTLLKAKSEHNNQKAEKRPSEFSKGKTIEVDSIDLCEWIKIHFQPEDYIILKMDIEGAEYAILNKMIATKTISYINEFCCEFHVGRCGVSKKEHNRIYKEISKYLKIKDWDAMQKPYLIENNCSEFKRSK